MFRTAAARRFARFTAAIRPSSAGRRARLSVQSLEDRTVPANTISIVDHATPDEFIDVATVGDTTTIATTDGSALLSLATIEAALTTPGVKTVVVTTAAVGTDADELGEIFWDGVFLGEQLDLTGVGTGKTLVFQTVAGTTATGHINLTGVEFNDATAENRINLVFNSSLANGTVSFGDQFGGASVIYTDEAVGNLTVSAGSGDFIFYDDGTVGEAEAAGDVFVGAGSIDISHSGGLIAGGAMTLSSKASVSLAFDTDLQAGGDLTISAVGPVTASAATLESVSGKLSIAGDDLTFSQLYLLAAGNLSVSGTTSVTITNLGIEEVRSHEGNVSITAPAIDLTANLYALEGQMTIAGETVTGWVYIEAGNLDITGTTSVVLNNSATDVGGVSVTGGTIDLNETDLLLLTGGDATVQGTTVNFNRASIDTQNGTVAVTGTAILFDNVGIGATGNMTITGPVTLGPGGAELSNGNRKATITFTDTINGNAELVMNAGTIQLGKDVGGTAALNKLDVTHGNIILGTNNLSAAVINLGVPGLFDTNKTEATLGTSGTVTGNITVGRLGNLAPGGLGIVGTMIVQGNVTFATPGPAGTSPGGDFAVDFGPGGSTDQLKVVDNPTTVAVEGKIDLTAGARLGGGLGTGSLTSPSAVIIDSTGVLAGEFTNAPIGRGILVGMDAITVTKYRRPDNTGEVTVAPMAAVGPVFRGVEQDGTGFTATLTGGGTLVVGQTPDSQWFLVVRNSTPASRLLITTRANASDDVVTLGAGLLVNGPLASLTAAKVNIGTQLRSSGAIATATFRDFLFQDGVGIDLGGTAANRTAILARNIGDDVKVGARLSSLRVTQNLGDQVFNPFVDAPVVSAPAIGPVTARSAVVDIDTPGRLASVTIAREFHGDIRAGSIGRFQAAGGTASLDADGAIGAVVGKGGAGLTLDVSASKVASVIVGGRLEGTGNLWEIDGGLTTLTAGAISSVDMKAGYLGTVLVKGNLTEGISGDIDFSTFEIEENDGTLARNGIRSLVAKGNVLGSTFDVEGGNVGTFTVGRFHFSQLHLNYTGHDSNTETFDTGGTFGSQGFRLGSFKTTAIPVGDPDHPLNWAFKGSEIAADTVGTITLSGLATDNGGTPFGIKIRTAGAIVKVTQADDPAVPLNTNLTPSSSAPYDPIAGDFFFIDV